MSQGDALSAQKAVDLERKKAKTVTIDSVVSHFFQSCRSVAFSGEESLILMFSFNSRILRMC